MPAGIDKIVPEPHLRENLIRTTHLDTGHSEIKKTYSLLEPVYTWVGMYEQVRFEVRACAACDRVKASFKVRDTVLKPLSIMGLFYRWDVDRVSPCAAFEFYIRDYSRIFSKNLHTCYMHGYTSCTIIKCAKTVTISCLKAFPDFSVVISSSISFDDAN
jgi:hypothetical protein